MSIRFESVSYVYPSGVRALDGVSLEVKAGELVAIVGENGAGKTTLIKLLNGLLRPAEGKVWLGEWDTSERTTAQLAAKVSFLFQNPDEQLFERTALQEVSFGPRNLGFAPERIERVSRAALERVGLATFTDTNPYDMPPFQRKMLAFAATLAMETSVLVLDEPTVGQDAAGRTRIGAILHGLQAQGRTILLVTHDLDFCAEHADRVVVMANGKIIADGPAADVLYQPDKLAIAAVTPPQLVRLASEIGLQAKPLTVTQFAQAYKQERTKP
jgi:energy-coupling factor transport system ATP-binding protein